MRGDTFEDADETAAPVMFHVDVNCAFLSWEAVYRIRELGAKKDLRDGLCAVGGDRQARRGIILAKSQSAKGYGVRTGESILEAKRKCPDLKLVPANYHLYQAVLRGLYKDFEGIFAGGGAVQY